MGRFISEDPIEFAGGDVNLFVYVSNNPLRYIDPLGLCSQTLGEQLGSQVKWYMKVGGMYPGGQENAIAVGGGISATVTGVTHSLSTHSGYTQSITPAYFGFSVDVVTGAEPSVLEAGGGSRHLGGGLRYGDGEIQGTAWHLGVSNPSLPAYFSISLD